MSQDQIQLPEPDGFAWHEGRMTPSGGYEAGLGFSLERPEEAKNAVFALELLEVFNAETVRRLIAEAVAKEREACALACESRAPCNGRMDEWDAAAVTCAAAIRARGAKT